MVESAQTLYFFPDQEVTPDALEAILSGEDRERRSWAVSHLLRYAEWDDIWKFVTRDQVREIFGDLDLPDSLRQKWASMLKIEAPVS